MVQMVGLPSNYSLSDDSTTADITAKALTITSASAADKTYDATDTASITAGTLSGFIGSETVTATATGQFADVNVGTGKSVAVTYSLADGTNGGLASNYSLSDDTTTADITAKALTITSASAADKTYDATDTASITAGTLSGFIGSETVTATATGQFADANVGTGKSVSVTYSLADGTNGGLASNYSLSDDTTTADITAKALTITSASAVDKTYDATNTISVSAGTYQASLALRLSPPLPLAQHQMPMLVRENMSQLPTVLLMVRMAGLRAITALQMVLLRLTSHQKP